MVCSMIYQQPPRNERTTTTMEETIWTPLPFTPRRTTTAPYSAVPPMNSPYSSQNNGHCNNGSSSNNNNNHAPIKIINIQMTAASPLGWPETPPLHRTNSRCTTTPPFQQHPQPVIRTDDRTFVTPTKWPVGSNSNTNHHPSKRLVACPAAGSPATTTTAALTIDTCSLTTTASTSPSYRSSTSSALRGHSPSYGGHRTTTTTYHRRSNNNNNKVDDLQKKIRLKTELCMHHESGRPCPWGENCTYAHGPGELQLTKLLDLEAAGLVEIDTYRIKPCLTFVSTGSCPFGKRCTCIHDTRVAGKNSHSWLPHTETQGNFLTTDINVDGLHQKRLHTILYDSPLGDQLGLDSKFGDLYNLVTGQKCTTSVEKVSGPNSRKGRVSFMQKLSIALFLRGTEPDWQYKYRPQHVIHGELCMVLQKRAFVKNAPDQPLQELSLKKYSAKQKNHILVHEIAFGPDSDPSVRNVALWFNIKEKDVSLCTPEQAKFFRWKKSLGSQSPKKKDPGDRRHNHNNRIFTVSAFETGTIDSFPLIRPHDKAAFELVTDLMRHHLHVLKCERMSNLKKRHETRRNLQRQKQKLERRFECHRRSWTDWAWPINVGRETVDSSTPVPAVEGPYQFSQDFDGERTGAKNRKEKVQRIWKSFIAAAKDFDDTGSGSSSPTSVAEPADPITPMIVHAFKRRSVLSDFGPTHGKAQNHRLAVFETLAGGAPIAHDRSLPHILKHRAFPYVLVTCKNATLDIGRQQERCWKSLLLLPESKEEQSEWEIVRDHFVNSHTKKILNIIQKS